MGGSRRTEVRRRSCNCMINVSVGAADATTVLELGSLLGHRSKGYHGVGSGESSVVFSIETKRPRKDPPSRLE